MCCVCAFYYVKLGCVSYAQSHICFSFPICTVITSFPHTSFKHKDITLHTPVGHTQQVGVLLVSWYLTGVSALGMSLAFTYIFVCMAICQFVRLTELTRTRTRALGHTCARQHTYTHTHTHTHTRARARARAHTQLTCSLQPFGTARSPTRPWR